MTVGVYDADFLSYQNVVPNLECAKYVTYYNTHHDFAKLVTKLDNTLYTKFIYRKDYDDGNFPPILRQPNVEYGGHAFSGSRTIPLPPEIEKVVPDMHLYESLMSDFVSCRYDTQIFKRLMNCAHIKLSSDGLNLRPAADLIKDVQGYTGIFLHDFDFSIKKWYNIIKEIQESRHFINNPLKINPIPVGNKFPIRISDSSDIDLITSLIVLPGAFYMEYDGLIEDTTLYNILTINNRMRTQLLYRIDYGCKDEQDFLLNRLPKLYFQFVFLSIHNQGIRLIYDDSFIKNADLQALIKLINYWINHKTDKDFPKEFHTLYDYCVMLSYGPNKGFTQYNFDLNLDDLRKSFQYVREHNYTLFQMFYLLNSVIYRDGRFINERTGDQTINS